MTASPMAMLFASIIVLTALPAATQTHARTLLVGNTTSAIRDALMRKFDEMDANAQPIFRDDVTPLVAPFFPIGQSFHQTQRVLERQRLGTLKPFRGKMMPGEDKMYVAKFSLMTQLFSDVYVVVDFSFQGDTADEMILTKVSAFLRATNM